MPDLEKLNANKERIILTLRSKGPSFPSRISKEVQISPLFVSAILAELVSEKRLKMSNMKVGSSPVYHLPGQENLLENFSQYLNHREREAYDLLKQEQILEDEKQEPAVRVALRAIKDFAMPINVKVKGETKIFWKYASVTDQEAREQIQKLFSETPKQNSQPTTPEKTKIENSEPKEEPKKEYYSSETNNSSNSENIEKPREETEEPKEETIKDQNNDSEKSQEESKKNQNSQKSKPQKTHEFPESVKDYLQAKDIEILEEISNKKKEFISRIRTDTLFGKQEYYLLAKEKKKVTEQDLMVAVQKAQAEKMPGLLISPGEPDKNAKEYLKTWRNLVKFEKINL